MATQSTTGARPAHPDIPRRNGPSAPISYAQEGLLVLYVLANGVDAFFNQQLVYKITDDFDLDAFERALNDIVARHEPLRTRFDLGSRREQIALDPWTVEVTHAPEAVKGASGVADFLGQELAGGWDLDRGRLLRAHLVEAEDFGRVVVMTAHHLAADPPSLNVLHDDLRTLYEAHRHGTDARSVLADLRVQYGDYAAWQASEVSAVRLGSQRTYWSEALRGVQPLELPFARPRGDDWSVTGSTIWVDLPGAARAEVTELARASRASVFMTFLTGFFAALARGSGADEVTIATIMGHRPHPETFPMVGMFANIAMLRVDCSGDPTFADLAARVRAVVLGALMNSELPLPELLSIPEVTQVLNRAVYPWIVVHYFALPTKQDASDRPLPFEPLVDRLPVDEGPTFVGPIDLHLTILDEGDSARLRVDFNDAIFDRADVEASIETMLRTLHHATNDPELPIRAI